jgi:hypothetical protein
MTTIGRWSPNKVRSKIIDAQWVSESRYAFELVKPSSVVVAGGSASATVSALGSVEFTSCETLSLDGVFSSGYDNYMLVMRFSATSAVNDVNLRLRAAGSDETGSNYTYQFLNADTTSVTAGRGTITNALFVFGSGAGYQGATGYVYGPNLAQPTAMRSVTASNSTGIVIVGDRANTHSLSTAYDGLTFLRTGAATFSGRVAVYGIRG